MLCFSAVTKQCGWLNCEWKVTPGQGLYTQSHRQVMEWVPKKLWDSEDSISQLGHGSGIVCLTLRAS